MTGRRPRARTALAVLASACVLAAGADTIAYAATGDSLLLGKTNKSSGTTTVKSAKGPALTLRTAKKAPPLKVSSNKVVKKLNADLLDGLDAGALEPAPTVYRLGADNGPYTPGFQRLVVPAGSHELAISALMIGGNAGQSVTCLVAEEGYFTSADLTKVILGDGFAEDEYSSQLYDSEVVTFAAPTEVIFGCTPATGYQQLRAARLVVDRVPAPKAGSSTVFTPRAPALRRLEAQLGR